MAYPVCAPLCAPVCSPVLQDMGDMHPVNVQEMLFAIASVCWDLLFVAVHHGGAHGPGRARGDRHREPLRNKLSAITKFCIRQETPSLPHAIVPLPRALLPPK